MKLKTITASALLLASLAATHSVSADEVVSSTETTVSATTTTAQAEQTTVAPTAVETTTVETKAIEPVQLVDNTAETKVEKQGTNITVTNPEVNLTFDGGKSKYGGFKVQYNDIQIPDTIAINSGDTLTLTMPKQVTFKTNFDFNVKSSDDEVVGHASTDLEKGTVVTVFNDVFTRKPINKHMKLEFDAAWTDAVKPGETVPLNFDGTEKSVTLDEETGPTPGEMLAKWGSQAKEDAQIMRWTVRANFDHQTLTNTVIKDRWTKDQEYIEGSMNAFFIEDVVNWKGITDAKAYIDSFHVQAGGFDMKLKEFNKTLYLEYRTRLLTPVKLSTDPINAVWMTADNGIKIDNYRSHISLVGGRGKADGANIEIPTELEKPETPEKPESPKPEEPKTPEKPEVPEKPEKPEVPETPEKPETPKPKVPEEPKKPEEPTKPESSKPEVPETPETPEKPESPKPVTNVAPQPSTQVLPNTGTSQSLFTVIAGVFVLIAAIYVGFKHNEN